MKQTKKRKWTKGTEKSERSPKKKDPPRTRFTRARGFRSDGKAENGILVFGEIWGKRVFAAFWAK